MTPRGVGVSSDSTSGLSPSTLSRPPADSPLGKGGNCSGDSGCYASSEQLRKAAAGMVAASASRCTQGRASPAGPAAPTNASCPCVHAPVSMPLCPCVHAPVSMPLCPCPCVHAPVFMPLCPCPCAPVSMPLCPCPCVHAPVPLCPCPCAPVSMPLCSCPCVHAPVFMPLCSCPCVHAPVFIPVFMPLCSCPCVHAPVFMPLCPCPCVHAPVSMPFVHAPVFMPLCSCPCVHAPVSMPLCSCPCVHAPVHLCSCPCAPVFMPLCPCPCVHAPVPLCPCPCIHAPVSMPLCPCPCIHAPVSMPLCPCPCIHAPVSRCLCRQCGKPKPPATSTSELSAEDQEVFSITVSCQRPPTTPTPTATLTAPPHPQGALCTSCTPAPPHPHSHSRCESKSSKQSLSSACTQLTSLSPEEEVGACEQRGGQDPPQQTGTVGQGHSHGQGSVPGHSHGQGSVPGHWEAGCVQCAQEAALLTSQMAGQESLDRLAQPQGRYPGYPYPGYGAYAEGYPPYPDCQTGAGGMGLMRAAPRTPAHYGMAHYSSAAQHYAPSHYRSHYAPGHYAGSNHHALYYGSPGGALYYPGPHYGSQAPYGGAASAHYRAPSSASSHYGVGVTQAGSQPPPPSPLTLSLTPTPTLSSSSSSQPRMALKLNRSVSHESGTLYPACASPRGPDYAAGGGVKATHRSPTRSLIPLLKTKLSAEGIMLTDEPYSTPSGECGVPPLLVQRYSEELRLDVMSVALVLEQVRTLQLHALQRASVPNEHLAEECGKSCNLQISSLAEFFISIGLPMYIPRILAGGISTVQELLVLTDADIPRLTGADSYHVKRIAHAIQWVTAKLDSPSPETSPAAEEKSGGTVGNGSAGTMPKPNSSNSIKDKV
ncbi:hypothetical protein ACOMHN_007932 [Nucella lapillus]